MTLWKRYGSEIISGPKYDSTSYNITVDVLNGMTFEQAGKKYGMTKQSANERFWLTVVRRPFSTFLSVSTNDLSTLRIEWYSLNEEKY